jgi:aminobenzoyl-glutamate utilization protein B
MGTVSIPDIVESQCDRFTTLTTQIWENPEVSLQEHKSAELIIKTLRTEGFEVETDVADLSTAFIGRYGNTGPVIGVLGEFDALPDLSQSRSAERDPVEPGEPGHGCGHNLFGVASLSGVVAVKRAIEAGDIEGSIVYFGTPAEEILVGKPLMIQAGVFDDVDAIISWHPWWHTSPKKGTCLAMNSIHFEFTGRASHAGEAPGAGRSALDAVQLLSMGAEFLREHIPDDSRIHYSIENAGAAPNIVDPEASVTYSVRAKRREKVESITDRLRKVARGAALMTETEVDINLRVGTYEVIRNNTIADLIGEQMMDIGPIDFAKEELAFGTELRESLGDVSDQLDTVPDDVQNKIGDAGLYGDPIPSFDKDHVGKYSTDIGNVSHVVPVGHFMATTWAVGTPPHSWQAVAASGSVGLTGMMYASKIIGMTCQNLIKDEEVLSEARSEFERQTAEKVYDPPLPDESYICNAKSS